MAVESAIPFDEVDDDFEDNLPVELSDEQAHAMFDQHARRELGISGEEFLRRWDAGEYPVPIPDDTDGRKIARMVMMLSFVR